jgi:hypothetical protein
VRFEKVEQIMYLLTHAFFEYLCNTLPSQFGFIRVLNHRTSRLGNCPSMKRLRLPSGAFGNLVPSMSILVLRQSFSVFTSLARHSKRELGNQLHQARRFKSAAVQYNKVRGLDARLQKHGRRMVERAHSFIISFKQGQGLTALVGLTAGNAEGANEHAIILPLRLNLTGYVFPPYRPCGSNECVHSHSSCI